MRPPPSVGGLGLHNFILFRDLVWTSDIHSACQTELKSEPGSVCPNRTDIGGNRRHFFFLPPTGKMTVRCSGRSIRSVWGRDGGRDGDGGRLNQYRGLHTTRGTFIQSRQTVRLLKLGIPRIVSALVSVTSVSCTSQQKKWHKRHKWCSERGSPSSVSEPNIR